MSDILRQLYIFFQIHIRTDQVVPGPAIQHNYTNHKPVRGFFILWLHLYDTLAT